MIWNLPKHVLSSCATIPVMQIRNGKLRHCYIICWGSCCTPHQSWQLRCIETAYSVPSTVINQPPTSRTGHTTQNFCFEGARVQVWILWRRNIYIYGDIYLILQSIVQKLRIRFRKNIFCQTSVVWSSHLRFQHISRKFHPPNGLIKVASEWPFNHNSCTMPRHGCWHRQLRRLRRWRLRLQRRGSTTAGPGWRSWLGLTPQVGKDPFLTQTIPYPTHVMNGTFPLLLSRVCHILKCLPSQNMKESSQASSLPYRPTVYRLYQLWINLFQNRSECFSHL